MRAARAGFSELPSETHLAPRLEGVVYSVSDGLLYCAIGSEDWAAVIDTCKARLENDRENSWARVYLALGLQATGRQTEARQMGEEVLRRGLERLERPAQPDITWDVHLYLAWAYRSLGRQDEAYLHLREYLAHRTLLHLAFGLENPILHVFKNDSEFNTLLDDLKQKFEVARQSIREYESASTQA